MKQRFTFMKGHEDKTHMGKIECGKKKEVIKDG